MNYSKSRRGSFVLNTNSLMKNNNFLSEAYYLSHNGLGDLIISTSAVRFLLNYYNRVHLLCSHIHHEQMKLILIDEPLTLGIFIGFPLVLVGSYLASRKNKVSI